MVIQLFRMPPLPGPLEIPCTGAFHFTGHRSEFEPRGSQKGECQSSEMPARNPAAFVQVVVLRFRLADVEAVGLSWEQVDGCDHVDADEVDDIFDFQKEGEEVNDFEYKLHFHMPQGAANVIRRIINIYRIALRFAVADNSRFNTVELDEFCCG